MPSPDERPAARPRPSFGLPGPTSSGSDGRPADGSRPTYGQPAPGQGASGAPSPSGAPSAPTGQGAYGAPSASGAPNPSAPSAGTNSQASPAGPTGYVLPPKGRRGAADGSAGSGSWSAGPPAGPTGPDGAAAPARRRGKLPLILGIVLILVALAAAIIGPVISVKNVISAIDADGNAISDGKAEVPLDEFDMILIYVPSEDAGTAECTALSPGDSSVQTDSGGGSVTFPNGTSYEQKSGVIATSDTTVTVECTGTTSADAMYVGPINVWGFLVPFFGGIVAGLFVGLIGLVLTIVGIVLLVRTRRA